MCCPDRMKSILSVFSAVCVYVCARDSARCACAFVGYFSRLPVDEIIRCPRCGIVPSTHGHCDSFLITACSVVGTGPPPLKQSVPIRVDTETGRKNNPWWPSDPVPQRRLHSGVCAHGILIITLLGCALYCGCKCD